MADLVPPTDPVRFRPSMEQIGPDEAQTQAELVETLGKISETVWRDSGHARRAVHAKSHGLLQGELIVLTGLPDILAQGLFAKPGSYPLVMRFSTNPGDILDDAVSAPRGLAIKVVGVPGERLPGSAGDTVQDIVLVNGPAFTAPDAKKFLASLKLLAATTDRGEAGKKALSAVARRAEAIIEAFGGKSPTLVSMGGQPATNVLGETFFTQVPILFGPYIAKLAAVPMSPELRALADAPLDPGAPNALRDAVAGHFARHGGEWQLRAQLCTDLDAMPIEDATIVWPERQSPYLPVARIVVPPQDSWSEDKVGEIDEAMAFSPWNGLAAHRPLGSVMRARKPAYESSAALRAKLNGCPIRQPRREELMASA